ncbi:hypothetical protein CapIbe_015982 [Capra ibex]
MLRCLTKYYCLSCQDQANNQVLPPLQLQGKVRQGEMVEELEVAPGKWNKIPLTGVPMLHTPHVGGRRTRGARIVCLRALIHSFLGQEL